MKFIRVLDFDGMLQICVQDKEVDNLYEMFQARERLFRKAYQHKTTNIIERM